MANSAPVKLTTDNITLDKIGKHYIELKNVTSSGDTLQFRDWPDVNDIFYINTGSNSNLPLNKDIPNGKSYGKGANGGDKVYAEIDAFRINNKGDYVANLFPAGKLSLQNANAIKDPAKRKQYLGQVQLHQLPVVYLTDNYVPVKNADGSVKKDNNGNPTYQIDSNRPKAVVYRSRSNYHDPYNGTPDWYRKRVLNNSDHDNALAMLEGLDYYIRGVEFVNYDYYTPTTKDLVDSIVDESAYKITPSANGLDGIQVDNAKVATLQENGTMSHQNINVGGMPEENNEETGEDVQTNTVETGTQPNMIKDVDPSVAGNGPLGTTNSNPISNNNSKPATNSTSKPASNNKPSTNNSTTGPASKPTAKKSSSKGNSSSKSKK